MFQQLAGEVGMAVPSSGRPPGEGREQTKLLAMEVPAHLTLTQSHPADKSIFAQPSCPQGRCDRGRFEEEHPAVTKTLLGVQEM